MTPNIIIGVTFLGPTDLSQTMRLSETTDLLLTCMTTEASHPHLQEIQECLLDKCTQCDLVIDTQLGGYIFIYGACYQLLQLSRSSCYHCVSVCERMQLPYNYNCMYGNKVGMKDTRLNAINLHLILHDKTKLSILSV